MLRLVEQTAVTSNVQTTVVGILSKYFRIKVLCTCTF